MHWNEKPPFDTPDQKAAFRLGAFLFTGETAMGESHVKLHCYAAGPSLTAHAKDAGMDVEQDAALLGALMRCKDARNAQARGSLVAEPVLTNYSLSEAVQHMRQMAVLLHSPN